MNEMKFLIYLDILGFGGLASEISSKKGIEERHVRQKFIETIEERIEKLDAKRVIIGKKYGEDDDWILAVDNIDTAFKCIYEILDHNTGYDGYRKIPLEFAVGTGEYDRWARFDDRNLMVEKSTINFMKTYIVNHYHKWYKQIHGEESILPTFVVLTESAYGELEPLDSK